VIPKADEFLVIAHGADAELARARTLLSVADASRVELHRGATAPVLVTSS
jgi:hypothetical protein